MLQESSRSNLIPCVFFAIYWFILFPIIWFWLRPAAIVTDFLWACLFALALLVIYIVLHWLIKQCLKRRRKLQEEKKQRTVTCNPPVERKSVDHVVYTKPTANARTVEELRFVSSYDIYYDGTNFCGKPNEKHMV